MREHFERALAAATEQGRPAGRCEILARMALEAARLGAERGDQELLELAGRSAAEVKELVPLFVGHQPWGASADAALAEVALARGDLKAAGEAGRAVVGAIMEAMREDVYPELLLPTGRAVLAAGADAEKEMVQMFLQLLLAMTALRTVDEEVRATWFKGPVGREWSRLAGRPSDNPMAGASGNGALTELSGDERRLLGLLTEGMTTAEMAERVDTTPESVRLQLQEMFAKIGASSRGEATAFALRVGVL
jgi:DNA-binding CsgD family transcriptional regulator